MKRTILNVLLIILCLNVCAQNKIISLPSGEKVILYSDKTWDYYKETKSDFDYSSLKENVIPSFLRQGIKVNVQTLKEAVAIYKQGWRYTMPEPKSRQACWGNYDGRTTWWYGYWYNIKTKKYSKDDLHKQLNGEYKGDNQQMKGYYRRGGSPSAPTKIQWLLSSSGGCRI